MNENRQSLYLFVFIACLGLFLIQGNKTDSSLDITQDEIMGHTTKTVIIDTNDTTAFILHSTNLATDFSYHCLVGGSWLLSGDGILDPSKENWIFPLPNSSAMRVMSKRPFEGISMKSCLLYTSPSPRDVEEWRMPGCG